jgi:hypothetical protein
MLTDISPDGVRIVVDWDKFKPGASVFIPCINTAKAIDVRVEDGKYGVRVWRLK